jgi:hypothetical protein
MVDPIPNPYQPPLIAVKLTSGEAADVRYRNIGVVVLLLIVTLGLYSFYLAYQWAKEINGLAGRVKYSPGIVLLLSIVTCGMGGLVFECLFASDIAEATQSRAIAGRMEQLATWVIACNCIAVVVSLIPFGVIVGMPLGILASALVQVELNKLADHYAGKR